MWGVGTRILRADALAAVHSLRTITRCTTEHGHAYQLIPTLLNFDPPDIRREPPSPLLFIALHEPNLLNPS